MDMLNNIHNMDCRDAMKMMEDKSVNLIVTSPPYSDQRKSTYGGIHPDKYVEWFLPIADEFNRILADDGSFVLNIKEKVVDGERHPYVMKLILEMMNREQRWFFTEEYIWHKKTSVPGKWPNRFRDAWERCIHFTKSKKFKMYQDEVKTSIGEWAEDRLKKLSKNDQKRTNSATKSGFGKNLENWVGKDKVYPSNVLYLDEVEEQVEPLLFEMNRLSYENHRLMASLSDQNSLIIELDRLRTENTKLKTRAVSRLIGMEPEMVYPCNVLHLPAECGNKNHSASFPESLPDWFIRLFTDKGDVVFDPFLGSGTTVVAAKKLGRQFIGTEILEEYFNVAWQRVYNQPRNKIKIDPNKEMGLDDETTQSF